MKTASDNIEKKLKEKIDFITSLNEEEHRLSEIIEKEELAAVESKQLGIKPTNTAHLKHLH